MDPNKYIKFSFYQMSDSVKAGGLFSEAQCKALAQKLIGLYDENKDGQLDMLDVGQMMGDCYRAMNKNYNPTPTDIAAYTRKMDTTGKGRIDVSGIEQLCLKYLSSGVSEDTSSQIKELPKVEKKIEIKQTQPEQQSIVLASGNTQNNNPEQSLPVNLKQSLPDTLKQNLPENLKLSSNSDNLKTDVAFNQETAQKQPETTRQQHILVQTRFLRRHSSNQYSRSPQQELPKNDSPFKPPEKPKPQPIVQNHEVRPLESYSQVVQERLKVARRIFTFIDDDKSGFITDQEVPQLLIETYKAMGMTIEPTQEDVELWMEMADLDRDGKVYLADYEDLILRSLRQQGIKLE